METRLLRYALEIDKKQNFTKAAESLRIAQPSLSQQISKLEQELGVSLFFRGHGKVTPTPEGIRFLKKAEQIIRLHDELEHEMREQSEGMGHELIIGTTVITGGHVLPPLLQSFGEQYPKVHIQLVEESTEKLTDLTVRGLVDLSILALPIEDPRLSTKAMLTERLFLAVPQTDRNWMTDEVRSLISLSRNIHTPLSLKELANAPFILLKKGYGFRHTLLELCAESEFQPQIAYETSSIQTALSLVKHGLGVTLVPDMVVQNNLSNNQSGPLYLLPDSHPTRTLVFAYHRDRYLSLASRAFLDVYASNRNRGLE